MPSFDPMVVDTVLIPAFKQDQHPTAEVIQQLITKFELPYTHDQLYTWFKNRRRYPGDQKNRSRYELNRDMKDEARTGTRPQNIMRGMVVTVLQQHFDQNMHPSAADIASISEELMIKHHKHVKPEKIHKWFNNRRCKLKLTAQCDMTHTPPKTFAENFSNPHSRDRSHYYAQYDLRPEEMLNWVDSVFAF